jgi:hypothetical protein
MDISTEMTPWSVKRWIQIQWHIGSTDIRSTDIVKSQQPKKYCLYYFTEMPKDYFLKGN